jgi:hypothetical protein
MRFRLFALTIAIAILSSLATWKVATAQVTAIRPIEPRVISGADIGFRVDSLRGATPLGRLVIKVNGQWVETDIGPGWVQPLSTR